MLEIGRSFGGLCLATVLMQLGSTVLMTYLALRLNGRGVAEFWVGALMAANALGMVLGGSAGAALIKWVGHVRTYAACSGLIAAAVLAHELSASLPVWLVLRAVVGLVMMCQTMVLESWLNEQAPAQRRGTVLALYMVATYVGMICGPLVTGLAGDQGVQALLSAAMAFALCQLPLALTRGTPPPAPTPVPVAAGALLRHVPQALMTVLASGAMNACFFGLAPIYARQQGVATENIGVFMAVVVGAGLLVQLPLGTMSDRLPRITLIRSVAGLLMFACLPLGFYRELPLAALMLSGAGIGCLQFCLYPLGVGLAHEQIEPEWRVALSGLLLAVFGVGSCLGPLLAGALMQQFGPGSLYYFSAACAGLLALTVSQYKAAPPHALRGSAS